MSDETAFMKKGCVVGPLTQRWRSPHNVAELGAFMGSKRIGEA